MEKVKITNEQEKQAAIAKVKALSGSSVELEKQIEEKKTEVKNLESKMSTLKDQISSAQDSIKKMNQDLTASQKKNAKEIEEIKRALGEYAVSAA